MGKNLKNLPDFSRQLSYALDSTIGKQVQARLDCACVVKHPNGNLCGYRTDDQSGQSTRKANNDAGRFLKAAL